MKRFLKVVSILAIFAAGIFVIDIGVIVSFSLYHPAIPKTDAVIVLGAKVGTPALTNRSLTGLRIYQEGKAQTLILSGSRGVGEPTSEAQAMQNVITERVAKEPGKPEPPTILLEHDSSNTYENIHNSRKLIPHAQSVVIVTDGYHSARAVLLAKHAGFKDVYWDSPSPNYYKPPELVGYYLREVVGMIFYLPKLI